MKMINKFIAISKGFRKSIFLSTVLEVVSLLISLAFIWCSKYVIDIATKDVDGSFKIAAFYTILLLLLQIVIHSLSRWITIRLQAQMTHHLRMGFFDRLLHSRWNEAEKFRTGDLLTRLSQDLGDVVRCVTFTLPQLIISVLELAAAFIFLYWLNKDLALTLVVVTPVLLLLSKLYVQRMRHFSKQIKENDSAINVLLQESFIHRTILKTFENEPYRINDLDSLQCDQLQQVTQRGRLSIFSQTVISLAFSLGYLIAFIWGGWQIQKGVITFGTMTAFLQLANRIQSPALDLMRMIPSLISTWTAAERLNELSLLQSEKGVLPQILKGPLSLVLHKVSFSYQSENTVLNGVDMCFKMSSMSAVVGETGAGKTTLIRLLLGLISPDQGSILLSNGIESVPVSSATRVNFIYVPQGNTLFAASIRDNLLMGNPQATKQQLHEALHTAVADFVLDLPEGINTKLGEQGAGLSEGQAQRIAIARALLRSGSVVIMDEATSALDTATEMLLIERLKARIADKTVIFITHHPMLAEMCDQVYRV